MRMPIPPVDFVQQYHDLQAELDAAYSRVMRGGRYILGQETTAFEQEFAAYVGASAGVGVASGTDAITIALQALGVGPGDEVVTVSHTAVATVVGVERTSARPVFVDIDPATFALNPSALEAAISARTRAIVPVHLYGHPADLAPILQIARLHGLAVVEDCAQAHGARYRGQPVGSFGDAAAFSFYPTKNLGAVGDGGIVVTIRPEVAERARVLREYGWAERYISHLRGTNSRLDELQAALLRVKLRHLERWNRARRELAGVYTAGLAGLEVVTPGAVGEIDHVYHLYVIRVEGRDRLLEHLRQQDIFAQIHYPVPVHLQPAYGDLGFGPGTLPETEQAAKQVLSLPLYPEMRPEAVETVVAAIRHYLQKE